ncbi:uncharacterized protein LOC122660539 [Telopea speciosissima]|uniref:uncharacterized protein LOC122660539 n=1 Tax=Telopea speciosissima TaxID=54955 RepID=UPI001CC52087|nr:uncharacterized protein LOC122660539 [Telopea speciosissima]XP_043711837.1 uncharacterized protein LOC122660539 [Telopea speciosissima]XP_043711838.1 uncharacterized protein LOC122660539 [Telopea speciosissima]
MQSGRRSLSVNLFDCFVITPIVAILFQVPWAASVVAPSSNCYAFDNSSHFFDFTSWIGHPFEYDGKDSDLVVRFCRDVESRSQTGYVDFGRFDTSSYFMAGVGHVSFVQGFYNGDLTNCEQSFDKRGRIAQVDIICGNCLNGRCKGELGCICNVTYDSTCRVRAELAIPCEKHGPRVFEGFTVGFHPRSWELVYNGMTQLGFEKSNREFSFRTEQTHVSLYMTASSALSSLVGKPVIKVSPNEGLEVELYGSGANGSPPTTLSPTILIIDWRCEEASDTPYQVNISIPVEGYEPVEFTLTKMCEHRQNRRGDATRGWATFGIFSCVFIVMSTLLCCGVFIYKTRVEHQQGLDALPGMTILSACLETVNGGSGIYSRAEDLNGTFVNQASWERQSVSAQGNQRTSDRRYGSI